MTNVSSQKSATRAAIKERPILFKTEMVQAILEGSKTQTRRLNGLELVNLSPDFYHRIRNVLKRIVRFWNSAIESDPNPKKIYYGFENHRDDDILFIQCPYGQPGDLLWVRETHMYVGKHLLPYIYKAGYPDNVPLQFENVPSIDCIDWKPSIYMPKEAARIWLRITDVRVERLQQISGEDALKEGVRVEPRLSKLPKEVMALAQFKNLWVSINGTGSWTANPWVWVISFEVLSTTGRPANL